MAKFNWYKLNACLMVILLFVLFVGFYYSTSINKMLKPPKPVVLGLELTTISADCDDCFNISFVVNALKQQKGLSIKKEIELSVKNAQAEIKNYEINRLPALIIKGDTEKLELQGFEKKKDALILTQIPLPYFDLNSSSVKGLVSYTILKDEKCKKCTDISNLIEQLKRLGIVMTEERTVDISSEEGQALIEKYNINRIPALIFSKDALEYDAISQVWEKVGTVEKDALVLRQVSPPYYDLEMQKLRGEVNLLFFKDGTCNECYDVNMHKTILTQNFGISIANEETYYINDPKAKQLISKYNIELVPTVVVAGDVEAYESLKEVWEQVGTIEDGAYVFRNVQLLEGITYKNLTSGEIVKATEQSSE